MDDKQIEQRLAREDQTWNGPRLHVLLFVTLGIALAIIYTIASWRTLDFTWSPLAHDPGHEILPAGW